MLCVLRNFCVYFSYHRVTKCTDYTQRFLCVLRAFVVIIFTTEMLCSLRDFCVYFSYHRVTKCTDYTQRFLCVLRAFVVIIFTTEAQSF